MKVLERLLRGGLQEDELTLDLDRSWDRWRGKAGKEDKDGMEGKIGTPRNDMNRRSPRTGDT